MGESDDVHSIQAQSNSEPDAWTGGAKWILNPNARILLNYIRTEFDAPIRVNSKMSDDDDALVLRAQYDF